MKEYKGMRVYPPVTVCWHCDAVILLEDATYLDGIWLCSICYTDLEQAPPDELPKEEDEE